MTKPARIIFILILTGALALLVPSFLIPASLFSSVPAPARAEPSIPTCPVDGQPVTNIDSSLLGIAANQYGPPLDTTEAKFQMIDLMGEAQIKYMRRGIQLQSLKPEQEAHYRWGVFDSLIQRIKSAGMEPVMTLQGTPPWASADGEVPSMYSSIGDWEELVEAAVIKYGSCDKETYRDLYLQKYHGWNPQDEDFCTGLVRNWEIWNEPDIDQFFKGTSDDYLQLLNTAYDIIKGIDPKAKVWGPTTIYFLDRLDDWMAPREKYSFTEKAINNGKLDVFTVHVYGDLEESYNLVKELRTILDSTTLKNNVPIALTETNLPGPDISGNCPSNLLSEEEHAQHLAERYYCLANAGAKYVFWWKPTDTEDSRCSDGVLRNGVLKTNLSPKPAYHALKMVGEWLDTQSILGDADGDGDVDGDDLNLLKQDYLVDTPVNNTDFNSDGRVDIEDFAILQANYSN